MDLSFKGIPENLVSTITKEGTIIFTDENNSYLIRKNNKPMKITDIIFIDDISTYTNFINNKFYFDKNTKSYYTYYNNKLYKLNKEINSNIINLDANSFIEINNIDSNKYINFSIYNKLFNEIYTKVFDKNNDSEIDKNTIIRKITDLNDFKFKIVESINSINFYFNNITNDIIKIAFSLDNKKNWLCIKNNQIILSNNLVEYNTIDEIKSYFTNLSIDKLKYDLNGLTELLDLNFYIEIDSSINMIYLEKIEINYTTKNFEKDISNKEIRLERLDNNNNIKLTNLTNDNINLKMKILN